MTTPSYQVSAQEERRVQAVLALLKGKKASHVSAEFRLCRSDVYKSRTRALTAMRDALKDHPPGPKRPYNRLSDAREQQVIASCQRYPTHSSYQVQEKLGSDAPSARTIQRVRKRNGIARLPRRTPPTAPPRRIPEQVMKHARYILKLRPHLGPERVVWDLPNGRQVTISTSMVKRLKREIHDALHPVPPPPLPPVWRFYERHHPHSLWHGDYMKIIRLTDGSGQTASQLTFKDDYSRGYVFCDLSSKDDLYTTVKGMMAAMRQWQVIPKAVLFDNGSHFRGKPLWTFCRNLGIRIIYASVNHPQTNGKLERAF
ncbi:MAG TPA: DDE-type integrase/transposase/recombinase [Candidatus Tectomicrobia bacterium]|nr:DDE-type integrase/transposase/recombinase [Candidatus Tectomicrobia bacterium]